VWDDTWIEGCGLVIRSGHMPYWYGKSLTAVVANYQLPVRAFARLTPRRASRRLATSPLPRSIVTTTQLLTGSALAGALALGLYGFVATRRAENGLREREGEIARLRERVEGLESKVTALQSVRTLLQAMQENKGAEATTRGAVTTPKKPAYACAQSRTLFDGIVDRRYNAPGIGVESWVRQRGPAGVSGEKPVPLCGLFQNSQSDRPTGGADALALG
jgi:hypothetical protein